MDNNVNSNIECKKVLLKILSAVLSILMFLTITTSCKNKYSDEDLIIECIEKFIDAYNDGDMDRVLECLDAKSRNAMKAMLDLMGGIAGSYAGFEIDLKDLFSLGISTVSDDFIEIEIIAIEIHSDDEAVVTTHMNLTDTIENEKIFFIMTYEDSNWYISDISEKKGGVSYENQNNIGFNSPNITKLNSKSVTFLKDDQEYIGVINSKGEIFYYIKGNNIDWKSVGSGAGYVTRYDNGLTVYDVINEYGEVVVSSENGLFDSILGYGDGFILVYKNTSNISKEEHSYGVINCSNGTWVKPLASASKYIIRDSRSYFTSVGEGVYLQNYYSGNNDNCRIYNSNSNQIIEIDDISGKVYGVNGVIYGKRGDNFWNRATICRDGVSDEKSLPSYFALYPDGTIKEIEPFIEVKDGVMIGIDKSNEYYTFKDIEKSKSFVYNKFAISNIKSIDICGNYILIHILGADGNWYFTVIDTSGNQCIEPIAVERNNYACDAKILSDRIIYKGLGKKSYTMIDIKGNILIPETKGYNSMAITDSNLIVATNSDGENCLLDLDGYPITIKLKN